jgi:hypothetical protein
MSDKSIPTWASLEESLFETWAVVQDLRSCSEQAPDEKSKNLLHCLAEVYDFKFNRTWDMYEKLTAEYYEMKHELKELQAKAKGSRTKGQKWDFPEF